MHSGCCGSSAARSSCGSGARVADRLVAWLYDTPVVSISPAANLRVTIDWEPAGIARWGLGSRALSASLPLGSPIRPKDDTGMDFFSNLLPEGPCSSHGHPGRGVPGRYLRPALAVWIGLRGGPGDRPGGKDPARSVRLGLRAAHARRYRSTSSTTWRPFRSALTLTRVGHRRFRVIRARSFSEGSPTAPGPGRSTVRRRRGSSNPTVISGSPRTRRRASGSPPRVGSPSPMWSC